MLIQTGRSGALNEDNRWQRRLILHIVVPGRNGKHLPGIPLVCGPLRQIAAVVLIVVTPGNIRRIQLVKDRGLRPTSRWWSVRENVSE